MTELVVVGLFSAFFLAIVDKYFDLKIGKLAVAWVGSILGSALMYSGSIPVTVATSFASAFLAVITLELVNKLLS